MWKPNSKCSSSSLKQVLNMFRFAEAFYLTCECGCVTLQVKCGWSKLVLLCMKGLWCPFMHVHERARSTSPLWCPCMNVPVQRVQFDARSCTSMGGLWTGPFYCAWTTSTMLGDCVCAIWLDMTTPPWWMEKVVVYYYYYFYYYWWTYVPVTIVCFSHG